MEEATDVAPLLTALGDLRQVIAACSFSLSAEDVDARRSERDHLRREIEGLVARIRSLGSPLLVVVGGVTGSGKSTMVNTLVGRAVSRTGVIRPTTGNPVLIVHPVDAHWFSDDRVMSDFVRVEVDGERSVVDTDEEVARLQLIRDEDIPLGLALVDAPDIDSLSARNRFIADALLDAADVWLWCTSAAKYADEESMRYLARGGARRVSMAVALTRVDTEDVDDLADDFRDKLVERASLEPELFTVETARVIDERLPRPAIGSIERWLRELSGPLVRRSRRRQTIEGALDVMSSDVAGLIGWVEQENETLKVLNGVITRTIAQSRQDFGGALDEGRAVRDEVLLRWNRFAGTSGMLSMVDRAGERTSWARSLMSSLSGERAPEEQQVRDAVASDIASLASQLLELASGRIVDEWGTVAQGRDLLEAHPELGEAPPDLETRTRTTVDEWQREVVRLVETSGARTRMKARWLSSVLNATATGLMVATLASPGRAGPAVEAGVAQAAGSANQELLSQVLGAANMRSMIATARGDLERRFGELLAVHRRRFTGVLAAAAPAPKLIDQLRERADAVQKVRSCLN